MVTVRVRMPLWGLCLMLGGYVPIMLPVHEWPGPLVANRFATDVDVEVRLTDGTPMPARG